MSKKIIGLLALLTFTTCHADVISVRADTWCPYNCDPKSDRPGYMIEILKETLGKNGHTIDYKETNWARAIAESRAGKFTAIVGAAKSDAPDFIYPDLALGKGSSCFFTLPKTEWKYEGIASLDSITVGVIRDYSYDGDAFDAYTKNNIKKNKRIDMVSGEQPLERNINKLKTGRIQALIEDATVFKYVNTLSKAPLDTKNVGCVKVAPVYAAFSPAQPHAAAYAKIVSEGLAEMRKSGKLKQRLAKYNLTDDF